MLDEGQIERIEGAKAALDACRPLVGGALDALRQYYDVELTYTSNSIEGNTLSYQETALVIEKGITIGGKTVAEHLEAQDHYQAVGLMRRIAGEKRPVGERDIVELHRCIVLRSRPEIAGRYASMPRRVAGSTVVFPNPVKVPALMAELGTWLESAEAMPGMAFDAHLRLVTIHPFSDGNGRTARLLMNLVLVRGGYPPIAIRPVDRANYLQAIEKAQLGQGTTDYVALMCRRLEETIGEYLERCREATALGTTGAAEQS